MVKAQKVIKIEFNDNEYYFYERTTLDNGQVAEIRFYEDVTSDFVEWGVAFAVADKKKHLKAWFNSERGGEKINGKQTGKNGISALLWAKQKIIDFIKNPPVVVSSNPQRVRVSWIDNRRKRVYMHSLGKCGFRYVPDKDYGHALIFDLKAQKENDIDKTAESHS